MTDSESAKGISDRYALIGISADTEPSCHGQYQISLFVQFVSFCYKLFIQWNEFRFIWFVACFILFVCLFICFCVMDG